MTEQRNEREIMRMDSVALAIRFHADVQKTPFFAPKRDDLVVNDASFPTTAELLETADAIDEFIRLGIIPRQEPDYDA